MKLLLQMVFWLSVVIVLLPNPPSRTAAPPSQTSGTQASAANAASADARRFCPRQLDACSEGVQAFAKLCREVYRFLTEPSAQPGGKSVRDAASQSHDTLTPADLSTPWRGSAPRKEPGTKRSS
jgi:hypothetical protein